MKGTPEKDSSANEKSQSDLFMEQQNSSGVKKKLTRRGSTTSNLGPNISLQKLQLELNIKTLYLKGAQDQSKFNILWVRGTKKIDTKTKVASNGIVKFAEKFIMKTTLEYDTVENMYAPKDVSDFIRWQRGLY